MKTISIAAALITTLLALSPVANAESCPKIYASFLSVAKVRFVNRSLTGPEDHVQMSALRERIASAEKSFPSFRAPKFITVTRVPGLAGGDVVSLPGNILLRSGSSEDTFRAVDLPAFSHELGHLYFGNNIEAYLPLLNEAGLNYPNVEEAEAGLARLRAAEARDKFVAFAKINRRDPEDAVRQFLKEEQRVQTASENLKQFSPISIEAQEVVADLVAILLEKNPAVMERSVSVLLNKPNPGRNFLPSVAVANGPFDPHDTLNEFRQAIGNKYLRNSDAWEHSDLILKRVMEAVGEGLQELIQSGRLEAPVAERNAVYISKLKQL